MDSIVFRIIEDGTDEHRESTLPKVIQFRGRPGLAPGPCYKPQCCIADIQQDLWHTFISSVKKNVLYSYTKTTTLIFNVKN